MLALTSQYDGPRTITSWSSGTGFAGIWGYAWVWLFTVVLGRSFQVALLVALILPLLWCMAYFIILEDPRGQYVVVVDQLSAKEGQSVVADDMDMDIRVDDHYDDHSNGVGRENEQTLSLNGDGRHHDGNTIAIRTSVDIRTQKSCDIPFTERWRIFLSLWPYVIPVVLVYSFEYTLMSGVW